MSMLCKDYREVAEHAARQGARLDTLSHADAKGLYWLVRTKISGEEGSR